MSAAITVVGSVNVDLTMQVEHIPGAGETVGNGEFSQLLGGKGANQALAAVRAGGDISFVGRVGDDGFGAQAVAFLKDSGIDTGALLSQTDVATGTALIFVDSEGENSIGVAPGANYSLDTIAIDQHADLIRHAAYVLMQLEVPLNTVQKVLSLANTHGTRVVLNAAPIQVLMPADLALVDILVVNQTETEQLTGLVVDNAKSSDLSLACASLHQAGVGAVIITLGAAGAFVSTGDAAKKITGHVVEVVDTTGAGDTFCGAFVTRLAELAPGTIYTVADLVTSVEFAQKAAALAVTRLGAQTAIPMRAAIDEFS